MVATEIATRATIPDPVMPASGNPIAESIQDIAQEASDLLYYLGGSDTFPMVDAEVAIYGEIMGELSRITSELDALAAKVPAEVSAPYAAKEEYLDVLAAAHDEYEATRGSVGEEAALDQYIKATGLAFIASPETAERTARQRPDLMRWVVVEPSGGA